MDQGLPALCTSHDRARKTAAKHQHHAHGDTNRIVQFHQGGWLWGTYAHQGGKLCYTNRGPWFILDKSVLVTYKIQRQPQANLDIVHVYKLMHYYPDFGEELHSGIKPDHSTQYQDLGDQIAWPALPTE